MKRSSRAPQDAPVVYIRRLRMEEMQNLSEDLRALLPGSPEQAKLFLVAPNKTRSNGCLQRSGRWQDNNFVTQHGIQMLILRGGCRVDFDTLCRGMVSDEVTGDVKKRAGKQAPEELLEDVKESRKNEQRFQRQATLAAMAVFDAFVVEDVVIDEDQARILSKWIGARDSTEHECCHCLLKSLHVLNAMLRDEGCKIIAENLPRNASIANINLGHNCIGDAGCSALFKANFQRHLTVLKLAGNRLSDKGCRLLTPLLETAHLVELHLQNNLVADEGARSIAQGVGMNATLKVLNLNGNRIRDKGVEAIAAALMVKAPELRESNAAETDTLTEIFKSGKGTVLGALIHMNQVLGKIPPEVLRSTSYRTNTTLASLHLSSNWLQDSSAEEIAKVMFSNNSLTNVELASNRVMDSGAKALAEALKFAHEDELNGPVGRNVVLNCNMIGKKGVSELTNAMKITAGLHSLSVDGMRVTSNRRALIQTSSAEPRPVDLTGSRKLPRIRLEAIHHEKKVIDLEALVAAEFRPKSTGKKSTLLKEALFPVDQFMKDNLGRIMHQSGWEPSRGASGVSPCLASTARSRLDISGGSSPLIPRGSTSARFPTGTVASEKKNVPKSLRKTSETDEPPVSAFYTGYLMNSSSGQFNVNLDDDHEFRTLCDKFEVPVEDKMRTRRKMLDESQRACRARIYDRFLDIQTKFHRPVITSAVQMQSMFRMRESRALARSIRKQNEDDGQNVANEAKHDLAADRNDGIHETMGLLMAPGKRQSFSHWSHHVDEAKLRKDDLFKMYASYCTNMGVSACGTSMLRKFVTSAYSDTLSFHGMGINALNMRALCFIFEGVETCKLCRGTGAMTAETFKGMSADPTADSISTASAFKAVDLDGSGYVDASELLIAFKHLGLNLTLTEVEAIMASIDEDKSGHIDQGEFELLFKSMTTERGPGQCVLCHGKGHCDRPCMLEDPWTRRVYPLLEIREWLSYAHVTELVLNNNNLRAVGAKDLVNVALRCGPALSVLRVAKNDLKDDGASAIAKLFSDSVLKLTVCDMSGNHIGDSGMSHISDHVQRSRSLTTLNLSSNACTGAGSRCLGEMLEANESLTELDISWNGIGGEQVSAFWHGVRDNTKLQRLLAAWNGFCDLTACQALSDAIENNSQLSLLDLSHNRLTEECCAIISSGFQLNETLIELHLDGNPIGITGAKSMLAAAEKGAENSDYSRTVKMEGCSVGVLDMSMFDPGEPAGRYMLDMQNESARQVLRNVLRLVAQGKVSIEKLVLASEKEKRDRGGQVVLDPDSGSPVTEFTKEFYVLKCFMTTQQFWDRGLADSNPMEWEMPSDGTLEFSVVETAGGKDSGYSKRAYPKLDELESFFLRCMTHVRTFQEKIEELETLLPSDHIMPFSQFKTLFGILSEFKDDGCLLLVEKFWNRVQSDACSRSVIALLSEDHRRRFFQRVGQPTFDFKKESVNNASGYYHLNLDIAAEKDIANLLLEAKSRETDVEQALKEYAEGRLGGSRDVEMMDARCWRHCTLNGQPFPFKRGWRVPASGILSLDFVKISKPDPEKNYGMSDGYFRALMKEISAEGLTPAQILSSIKSTSNNQYWTCKDIVKILEFFPTVDPAEFFQPRVELFVTVFGRTLDWLGLIRLFDLLFPFERKALAFRIGEENIFAEAMAVNHYELDLADAAQRYILQELVHIAVHEEGENFVQLQYMGCDYKMPASWVSEMPKSGKLSLFYARSKQVINRVMEKGTCDVGKPNPLHHPVYFSEYVPAWLLDLGQSAQPHDFDWMDGFKIRTIKSKIQEAAGMDPVEAFNIFDEEGSGSMTRLEIVEALFRIGLWLNQSEISLLMSVLDTDGGGNIEVEEFVEFWNTVSWT